MVVNKPEIQGSGKVERRGLTPAGAKIGENGRVSDDGVLNASGIMAEVVPMEV